MKSHSILVALALSALLVGGPAFADDPAPPAPPASATPPPPTPADPAATAAMVTKVQAFYDGTTTFVTPFDQEFYIKSHNLKKTSTGKVFFSKPGKMAFDYADPAGNRVVSDGTMLRVFEAANKQMFEQTIDKSQYPAALSFLTGTGRLDDSFNFIMYSGDQMQFPGGQVLVGTPKQPSPAYTKVLFYVDVTTSHIRRTLIVDAQGNRNRFDFTAPTVNATVDPNEFQLVPPPGTQVIRP